jgi:hypothetical protein
MTLTGRTSELRCISSLATGKRRKANTTVDATMDKRMGFIISK